QWNPLFANDGTGHFTDRSKILEVENADWAWGTVFFDCDHDGDLDLYVANGFITQPAYHNRFFQNLLMETGTVSFSDISAESGTDGTAEARSAIAFDFDGDGDLDILVSNTRPGMNSDEANEPYLYENISETQNWLQIDLEGAVSNRSGFGTVVRVTSSNGTVYRHNDGVGYLGQNDAPVHVGIGDATVADEIRVSWPSGLVEVFTDIAANQKITVVEGQGTVVDVDRTELPIDVGFAIGSAYPNPFGHSTSVELSAKVSGSYGIEVVNVLGQTVSSRQVDVSTPGTHRVSFDLAHLPPGLYSVRAAKGAGSITSAAFITKLR
ncbi:MAG TPA: ASPIC/UnbV domain-containing protein, partial [Rhodothermales bacterium]